MVNDFGITVELDSPLLLGGAFSGRIDPARIIRPASVRGLMHTFARALFGPLLGSDGRRTRDAERRLLGAQGGTTDANHHEYGATFRLEAPPIVLGDGTFPNCPHDQRKGARPGFREGQTARLIVRPRPAAAAADPHLPAMLWVVLWTGLTFGALGNRSRRGYGSLTVTGVEGVDGGKAPGLAGLLEGAGNGPAGELPTWPALPSSRQALADGLCRGLETARAAAKTWLEVTIPPVVPAGAPEFFQLFGPERVYVGRMFSSSQAAMSTLMQACSRALNNNAPLYRRTLGAGGRNRLASPLWVRLYRTKAGWVPVATFSGDPGHRTLVDRVLRAIGCIDANGTHQTLNAVAGGGGC